MYLAAVGCNASLPKQAATSTPLVPTIIHTLTPSVTSTLTLAPTVTVKPSLTSTKSPAATQKPSSTPSCSRDLVLAQLKETIPYTEFAVFYNSLNGLNYLNVWFVDQGIKPDASDLDMEQNAFLALRHAAILSQEIRKENQCIDELFSYINPIVVDSNYNGWFSGTIRPVDLRRVENVTEPQIEDLYDDFEIIYWRHILPSPQQASPRDSCNWVEALDRIKQHFDPSRENVSFHFVIDQTGVDVNAQWDYDPSLAEPQAWLALQVASTMNVAIELACLHPAPTQLIVTVVDSEGRIVFMGILPDPYRGLSDSMLNDFKIIYQDF